MLGPLPRGLSHEGPQPHPHPSCHAQTQSTGGVQARGGGGSTASHLAAFGCWKPKTKRNPPKRDGPPPKRGNAGGVGGRLLHIPVCWRRGCINWKTFPKGGEMG